ncbi:MAG: hypothetical protein LBV20_04590 [Treponema sp.]|jgi:hypothetical protein|nr:hypothetical protein [Treponema sp.]
MNKQQETGLFFTLDELKIFFSSLKSHEDDLSPDAETALVKIERFLYEHLTIREIESLSQSNEKYF